MIINNFKISVPKNNKNSFLTHNTYATQVIRKALFIIVIQGLGVMEVERFCIGNGILRPDMTKTTSLHNQLASSSHMCVPNFKD